MLSSVALAAQARAEYLLNHPGTRHTILIAASIGPYGAVLADGSEYSGAYDVSASELGEFHADRIALLDRSDADLLAFETIPSCFEAEVLADLLQDVQSPAWVSFSCRDDTAISDGTPIEEAVRLFEDHPRVLAVGVNCTPPQYMLPLIRKIGAAVPEKAILVYPNSGESYEVGTRSWSGTATPTEWSKAARTWVDAGAHLIGGCCRTGPEHIRAIAASL